MLKTRIIPILTFNGFGLVKTKQFNNPRMVGNPVQAARVYNSRGVDELAFIDIFATKQKRKLNLPVVKDIIKECFMPVAIGGAVSSIDDISNLLKIGADKVIIKTEAILNPNFIREASNFFGAQCITIAIDAEKKENKYFIKNDYDKDLEMINFMKKMEDYGAGEFILNSVNNDGIMNGFDIELNNLAINNTSLPIISVGGGGNLEHFKLLFENTNTEAVGSASIFHFTQYTPLDIKNTLIEIGKPVRI